MQTHTHSRTHKTHTITYNTHAGKHSLALALSRSLQKRECEARAAAVSVFMTNVHPFYMHRGRGTEVVLHNYITTISKLLFFFYRNY